MLHRVREGWSEVSGALRLLPWTLRLLWRSHRPGTIAVCVMTLVHGVVPAAQLWVTKLLVDQLAWVVSLPPDQRTGPALSTVFVYLGLEAGVLVAGALVGILSGHAYNVLGENLSYAVQMRILEQCARLDLAVYESPAYYNLLQQAQEQAEQAPMLLLRRLLELAQSAVVMLSMAALIVLYQPWLLLLLIATTLPGFWNAIHYGRKRFFLYDQRTPVGRRALYLSQVLSTEEYAKEVRIWGLKTHLLDLLRALRLRFKHENLDLSLKQSISTLGGEVVSTAGYYGAYAMVVLGVVAGRLTLGDLTLYAGAFGRSQSLFQEILESIAGVYELQLFVRNLAQFLALEPQLVARAAPGPAPSGESGLRLEALSFRYPGTETRVLSGIDVSIRPGECVAIVGANGSGKTTLVKLLLRLYDPVAGCVRLDGVDVREIDPTEYRKRIAVVFQDYARYQLTARENIGFGKIEDLDHLDRIQQAARDVGIDHLLDSFPDRYETLLGRHFEGGRELSLGQWQRVAVARALLRDAPIVILDEPTAAMDAEAEHDLYEQLKRLARGRITLLISHRFSTVRMADRILVLEGGRIIEEGTHEDLLARDTRYSYFFKLQAASYQTAAAPGRDRGRDVDRPDRRMQAVGG